MNRGRNVMEMSKPRSGIISRFENMLWANSPDNWIIKLIFFQEKLYISILIPTGEENQFHKIRRDMQISVLRSREQDLFGLASDCIDEMKTEAKRL